MPGLMKYSAYCNNKTLNNKLKGTKWNENNLWRMWSMAMKNKGNNMYAYYKVVK